MSLLLMNQRCKCMFEQVEEKLESGQGKSAIRKLFARFCTPIFLEVSFHILRKQIESLYCVCSVYFCPVLKMLFERFCKPIFWSKFHKPATICALITQL
jgi:hypothetical protein